MFPLIAYFKILVALIIMAASSLWIFYLSVEFTSLLQSESLLSKNEKISFPSSIEEIQSLSLLVKAVYAKNSRLILMFFCSAYFHKQTFAIPGSVFLNLLAGSLFGLYYGMIICCSLSTLGAMACFYLSKLCGEEILEYFFKRQLAEVRKIISNQGGSIFFYLLSARLFPATPNWLLNMSSPLVGVPWYIFASSCFIGLMPCIYLCVQTGEILSEITSISDVYSTSRLIKITLVALVSVAPNLYKFIKKKIESKKMESQKIESKKIEDSSKKPNQPNQPNQPRQPRQPQISRRSRIRRVR